MKRYLFTLIPFCLVVPTLAAGDENVVYDGTTYVVPVPSGFVRYDQSFPQLAEPTKRAILHPSTICLARMQDKMTC